jgi:hypothetical protein
VVFLSRPKTYTSKADLVETDILSGMRERIGTIVRHKVREGYIWEAYTNYPDRRPIGAAHTRKAAFISPFRASENGQSASRVSGSQ